MVEEDLVLPFLLWPLLDSPFVAGLQGHGCTEREWGQIVALVLVLSAGWSFDGETALSPSWGNHLDVVAARAVATRAGSGGLGW